MRLAKIKEEFLISLSWLMPRKLVYWCAIRLVAHAMVGRYSSQIVPELTALEALKRWTEAGLKVCIYSSGSVAAQKLIFGHSDAGDLTPFLSGYFDTTTGPKRDPDSYSKIVDALDLAPQGGVPIGAWCHPRPTGAFDVA